MSEETIRLTVSTQLNRVRVPGICYAEYAECGPGFGVALMDHGLLDNGPQPVRSKDGKLTLMMDGEIYNGGELKRRFRNELPEGNLSTPELCLWLIVKFGTPIVDQFNGLFVLVLYERDAERLTLITDRFRKLSAYFLCAQSQQCHFSVRESKLSVVDPTSAKWTTSGRWNSLFMVAIWAIVLGSTVIIDCRRPRY